MDQSMASPLQVTPMLIFMFFFAKILALAVCIVKDVYILQCFPLASVIFFTNLFMSHWSCLGWNTALCTKYGKNAGLNEKRGNVLATSEVSIKRLNVAVHRLSNILASDHIEYKRAITVPSLVFTYFYH